MSLVNLVATACEPQYPAMFLVLYGGEPNSGQLGHAVTTDAEEMQGAEADSQPGGVSGMPGELVRGAVGKAYGSLRTNLSGNLPIRVRSPPG